MYLFLYRVTENGQLQNQELPGSGSTGAYGHPPLQPRPPLPPHRLREHRDASRLSTAPLFDDAAAHGPARQRDAGAARRPGGHRRDCDGSRTERDSRPAPRASAAQFERVKLTSSRCRLRTSRRSGPHCTSTSAARSSGRGSRPTCPGGRAVDGVRSADGFLQFYAQMVDRKGDAIGTPEMGAPTSASTGSTYAAEPVQAGARRPAPEGPDQVVIDKGTADGDDFSVGDRVQILTRVAAEAVRDRRASRPSPTPTASRRDLGRLFDTATAQEISLARDQFDTVSAVGRRPASPRRRSASRIAPRSTTPSSRCSRVRRSPRSSRTRSRRTSRSSTRPC